MNNNFQIDAHWSIVDETETDQAAVSRHVGLSPDDRKAYRLAVAISLVTIGLLISFM
jgi:hypothetical protein